MAVSLKKRIIEALEHLSPEQQTQVLVFTESLKNTLPPGTPGDVLLERMDSFEFEPDDLAEIA